MTNKTKDLKKNIVQYIIIFLTNGFRIWKIPPVVNVVDDIF